MMLNRSVGILTSEESFLTNYGAVLQGYALSTCLSHQGYSPSIVRYEYIGPKRKFALLKDVIKYVVKGKDYRDIINAKRRSRNQINFLKSLFQRFQDENISFASDIRYSWETIQNTSFPYEAFVCGSDQIWNPVFKNNSNDRGYFLDFVPEGVPRIAYAPSIGVSSVPESCTQEMKDLLEKFDAVSVREQEGAEIIKRLLGRECFVAVDPTLLLEADEWRSVERLVSEMPEHYILVYQFGKSSAFEESIRIAEQELSVPAIDIALSDVSLSSKREKRFDVGPAEFLWLIDHADLVMTDSFHASVFSILFETPFVVFGRESFGENGASMDGRVINLLELFSMMDCFLGVETMTSNSLSACINCERDSSRYLKRREESLQYLLESLNGAGDE